uniref:hypothetical protein n=1 Tax=Streptomyces sp. DG1A-41 TaxID=3125779 RepID=UPI0040403390
MAVRRRTAKTAVSSARRPPGVPRRAVPYDGGQAGRTGGAGIVGEGPGHLLGERVERPGAVPGLRHTGRPQEQRLVGGHPQPPYRGRAGRSASPAWSRRCPRRRA